MPRPPSDVFRPRLPLDPFAAVDVRAPWLVPQSLPHSPPQVILILGEPPASELLPLLTSPHLARSLLLLASHAPPPLPLLPPTTPGPAVRILRLAAPLAVQDSGALRLVALLEKAHRVAARWRLALAHPSTSTPSPWSLAAAQSASSSSSTSSGSWGAGPGQPRGASWPGSAANRVVQLAEAQKTGEFTVLESVVYLRPRTSPDGLSTAAAPDAYQRGPLGVAGASADPRGYNYTTPTYPPSRPGGDGNPAARPSPTPRQPPNRGGNHGNAPQNQQQRYPSPAPSVAESLSSSTTPAALGAHPKKDGGGALTPSSGNSKKRFSALSLSPSHAASPDSPPSPIRPSSSSSYSISPGAASKKLRKRSTSSASSLSLSPSSASISPSASKEISPFAASVPQKGKGTPETGASTARAFDAILNFLPANVPDKQLLKHTILVTTLGARYLEGDAATPSDDGRGKTESLGRAASRKVDGAEVSRRFSAFSVFSFGSSSDASTPDLLASRTGSAHSLAFAPSAMSRNNSKRPQSAYSVATTTTTHADEDTEVGADTEADTEVEMLGKVGAERKAKKRRSVRKRISAFLGGGGEDDEVRVRKPDAARKGYGFRVEEEEMGKGKRPEFLGSGSSASGSGASSPPHPPPLTAHVVHVLPASWVDWEEHYALPPTNNRRSSGGAGLTMAVAGRGAGPKPKLVQSVEQFLLSFAYPLGSLGGVAGPARGQENGGAHLTGKESGRAVRPPPSAYPGARSGSGSGSGLGGGGSGSEVQHQHQQNGLQNEGRLAALARQHRPVPYLVAPALFRAPVPLSLSVSPSSPSSYTPAHGPRPLTHGEAILLGALDVDPASGSRAGTGRAWVGVGDVRVLGGPPPSVAHPVAAVEAVPGAMLVPPSSSSSVGRRVQAPLQAPESPDRSYRNDAHPHAPRPLDEKGGLDLDLDGLKHQARVSVSRSDVQLPTPPESSGSSSGESVEGEDEEEPQTPRSPGGSLHGASSDAPGEVHEAAQSQPQPQPQPQLQLQSQPQSEQPQSPSEEHAPAPLQRRPTRNHRPAPPPPSVPSPVRAALESLVLRPTDPTPPPRVIALPTEPAPAAAKPDVASSQDLEAFPAIKGAEGVAEVLVVKEGEGHPARPRTVHVSDAHRTPPVVVNLNRSASQSTSALLHPGLRGAKVLGVGGKAEFGERERERKGYAHGLQAVWRRIAVWRAREKGAQKASGH